MYDRQVNGKTLEFEASGALYHSALVMEDNQTGSHWAMMTHKAIAGPFQDAELTELPISEKTTWSEWKQKHPETLLLVVEGNYHIENSPYDNYFNSDKTFGEATHVDDRLPPKTSIFTFQLEGHEWVVTHDATVDGIVVRNGTDEILIYRPKEASFYRSTRAWLLAHNGKPLKLEQTQQGWQATELGLLDPLTGKFPGGIELPTIQGMDTFWYIWSQYHKDVTLVTQSETAPPKTQ